MSQPSVPQQSTVPQLSCLVSSSKQLQEQSISLEVAVRIAAPQRQSTRVVYKSKWSLFEKLVQRKCGGLLTCEISLRIFHVPISRPKQTHSTIDGYRTAIVDYLGSAGLHISQSCKLNRLLTNFHRDRPKNSRNLTKWNLSVVLNEHTKAPFESIKDPDLKHLTLKMAVLLALASRKHHDEIQVRVVNKVSNLGQNMPPNDHPCFDHYSR